MANLLEKASIVLTPTAYNNGEALCIKPDDASGDFQFSRNSAATRVNAQGLVENVQILSSNLVQNGDFSEEGAEEVSNGSFSQEGAELVTNGSFDTDSDWTLSGWSISGGSANNDGVNTGNINQNIGLQQNKFYKISINITNYFSGVLKVRLGTGDQIDVGSSNGEYILYLENTTTNPNIRFYPDATLNFQGSIDNVSVREVGQDWTLGTGWSIGEDKAVRVSTGTYTPITQGGILTAGKSYKVNYTINEGSVGGVRVQLGGTYSGDYNGVGTHTVYGVSGTSDFNNFKLVGEPSFNGSITNISVKEVGQNWNLIGTATITENQANIVTASAVTGISQTNVLTIGESYKLTYNIVSNNNGGLKISGNEIPSVVGNNTYYFEATATALEILRNSGVTDITITNISVIEITDDTNLPRINYEGFSYQDALGSELITNGSFDTDSDWTKDTSWTISSGKANYDATLNVQDIRQNVAFQSGKIYKISFTVSDVDELGGKQAYFALWTISNGAEQVFSYTKFNNGTYTFYYTAISGSIIYFNALNSSNGGSFSIDNVSVKEYLGQEVVPDSGCGSWLWEPQSTNLIPYSEDFSDSSWVNSNSTDTSNYGISPDGLNNSTRFLTTANTGSFLYINSLPILDATNYTLSFWVKSNGNSLDKFRLYTTTGGTSLEFTSTNKWVRYEYNFLSTGTTTNLGIRGVVSQETDIQIWGAQLEQQSYATSYIPTEGSTVTRNQDVCNNGGSLASINSTEGVFYAEIARSEEENLYRLLGIDDGTSNNYVKMGFENSRGAFWIRAVINGVTSISSDNALTSNPNEFYKIAIRYQSGNSAIYINGTSVLTTTTTFSSGNFTALDFNHWNNSLNFFGKTKALAVWKEALSDEELTELTTI